MFPKKQSQTSQADFNQPMKDPSGRPQSVFDRVAGAEPGNQGVYPVAGTYPVLACDVLKMITSRKGDDLFIAEFQILQSNVEDRPAGTRMSWAVNFRHDASPRNVKDFLCALMNCLPEEIDADGVAYACGEDNPCAGRLVRLEASLTETKSGGDFTVCRFAPLPDSHQEKADEYRKAAGFAPF